MSAISLLQGIKPADEIEGMLAAQMVATHHAAMKCLRRAMIVEQTIVGRDQNLKHAGKLLSIYSRQIEVLDKHRGKDPEAIADLALGALTEGGGLIPSLRTQGRGDWRHPHYLARRRHQTTRRCLPRALV